ncbi:MAG TPA: alpha/beta fold hydrolase [Verrucomicrobiae bacterium]|nr:alpha/beta fold hydrolase [Verrucomicrobiae bacterium]
MKKSFYLVVFLAALNAAAASVPAHFRPAWWSLGAHPQTIWAFLLRPYPDVPVHREQLAAPDGDFFDVDWMPGEAGAPVVIMVHGLGSSSESKNMRTLMKAVHDKGWQGAALNWRGALSPNKAPIMDNSGRTEDLAQLVREVLSRYQAKEIYLVGYSAGGNKVLKYLGENPQAVPPEVKKAVAVSAPYDLEKSVDNLDKGLDKVLYTKRLLKALKARAAAKEKQFPGLIPVEKAEKAGTFREYDRLVTAPLAGFMDEKEYYTAASCGNYLEKIDRPALLVHARNDPFLHGGQLPLEKIKNSAFLHLMMTPDGGHLGFVTGFVPFRTGNWLEKTIVEFLGTDA